MSKNLKTKTRTYNVKGEEKKEEKKRESGNSFAILWRQQNESCDIVIRCGYVDWRLSAKNTESCTFLSIQNLVELQWSLEWTWIKILRNDEITIDKTVLRRWLFYSLVYFGWIVLVISLLIIYIFQCFSCQKDEAQVPLSSIAITTEWWLAVDVGRNLLKNIQIHYTLNVSDVMCFLQWTLRYQISCQESFILKWHDFLVGSLYRHSFEWIFIEILKNHAC